MLEMAHPLTVGLGECFGNMVYSKMLATSMCRHPNGWGMEYVVSTALCQ